MPQIPVHTFARDTQSCHKWIPELEVSEIHLIVLPRGFLDQNPDFFQWVSSELAPTGTATLEIFTDTSAMFWFIDLELATWISLKWSREYWNADPA